MFHQDHHHILTGETSMRMLIVITLLMLAHRAGAQEFSTTGLLRSIDPSRVEFIEQTSAGDPGRVSSAVVTPQTSIEGCTLDAVRKGASVALALTTDSAGTRTATRIVFYTCRENTAFSGTVVGREGTTVTVRNASWDTPFALGGDVAVTFLPTSQVVACSNLPLDVATLSVGRTVSVNGQVGEDGTSVVASYFVTTDDCVVNGYTNGVVQARTDSSLIMDTDLAGVIEALAPLANDGTTRRDPDMLGVTTCVGEPRKWTDIRSGDTVQVLVTLYPDGRADLGGVTILSDCPTDPTFGRLEGIGGLLVAATSDSIVVRTERGRDVTVALRPTTFIGDCSGRPQELSAIAIGSNILVSGRRINGTLTATYIIDLTSCTVITTSAVIEAGEAQSLTIRTESGRSTTVAVNDESRITDCSGRQRSPLDPRLRERLARVVLDVSTTPATVRTIDVEIDCPAIVYASGTIAAITPESVRIDTMGLDVVLERSSVFFTDLDGNVVAWDDLAVGQAVCVQYTFIPGVGSPLRAIVLVGVSCNGEPGAVPLVASGIVIANDGDRMMVRSNGSDLEFALTGSTNVDGAATIGAVIEGSSVRVTSNERLRSLQPVASLIEVRGTTSVVDDVISEGDPHVWPNPASERITIAASDVITTTLLDVNGRALLTSNMSTMDVSTIPAGLYIVRSLRSSGDQITSMVVVTR
jgi:RNase P/RNase MRP subunit p29